MKLLSSLQPGEGGIITCLPFDEKLSFRMREMGLLIGTRITFVRAAPMGDPLEFRLRGFDLSIRRDDATQIIIDETRQDEEVARVPSASPPAALSPVETTKVGTLESGEVVAKGYAVIGNPNSGKTTLFNSLTGMHQKVGNYPGVTVEKKSGQFIGQHGEKIGLLDLPGSYSLGAHAPDERITRDVLLGLRADTPRPERLLCVLDASHLERNLYFITQVLELGLPTIIALNMIDIAEAQGIPVDAESLSRELGVPVIPIQATDKASLLPLRLAMSRAEVPASAWQPSSPPAWTRAVDSVAAAWNASSSALSAAPHDTQTRIKASLLISSPDAETALMAAEMGTVQAMSVAAAQRVILDRELPEWRESLVSARYDRIGELCLAAQGGLRSASDALTERLDDLLTHPVWGWVCFIGMMTLMFVSLFSLAKHPMDLINNAFDQLARAVEIHLAPGDLRDLITEGIISGVGGVVVFLPQILILFFFIGLLEDTGYMARAAFLMDRLMSKVGLHGKSFIPLLSSYACAIPGIMSTRTIENPKDRLVTILVAPFMSCSARLPVYALMIAALMPASTVWAKGSLLMGLYLLGTLSALLFAWLFKKTILKGDAPLFLMELPPYRIPALHHILTQMIQRAGIFLRRAGTVILAISIILWFLASFPKASSPQGAPLPSKSEQLQQSFAGHIGHALEPLIAPLGMDWKIGIGLIAAQAAREVFVGTLSIVYDVERNEPSTQTAIDLNGDASKSFKQNTSLSDTLRQQVRPDHTPVYTPLTCLSILIFFVYSMQCVSTLAVVRRETNSFRWPLFQLFYMTATAYVLCLIFYQGGKLLGFH
jgi:ferrous iron transport protein B